MSESGGFFGSDSADVGLQEHTGEIECIGVDNKQHVCQSSGDVCKCGVTVKRKKLLRDDHKLLSCYECTY